MSIFVQYAPYKLEDGDWDTIKEAFADRCIGEAGPVCAQRARRALSIARSLSPLDLEREFRPHRRQHHAGGDEREPALLLRPVPGWADHRTPVAGLYLCGAASHPGGGVMGVCGRNAAEAILQDRP